MKYLDKEGLTYAWSKIKAKIDAKPDLDKIYPVGSIYMTMASSNPGDLFGGTWTKLSGGYLYADTNNPGAKGGSNSFTLSTANLPAHTHSTPSHTHGYTRADSVQGTAISANQMAAHTHNNDTMYNADEAATATAAHTTNWTTHHGTTNMLGQWTIGANASHNHGLSTSWASTGASSGTTGSTGGGQAVNIRPTYINVYMWQRTA